MDQFFFWDGRFGDYCAQRCGEFDALATLGRGEETGLEPLAVLVWELAADIFVDQVVFNGCDAGEVIFVREGAVLDLYLLLLRQFAQQVP